MEALQAQAIAIEAKRLAANAKRRERYSREKAISEAYAPLRVRSNAVLRIRSNTLLHAYIKDDD